MLSAYAWSVPRPYRGELGYGTVSRFLSRWDNLDQRELLRQVSGRAVHTLHPMTVPKLATIAGKCLHGERDCVGRFVNAHTLVPYATAFDTCSSRRRLLSRIRTGESCGAESLRYACRYEGLAALTLRLCPECFVRDTAQVGEPYWHRVHQLPAVYHCPLHGCVLHSSSVRANADIGLRALTPDQAACPFDSSSAIVSSLSRRLESRLLSPSLQAASSPIGQPSRPSSPASYRNALFHLGYEGRGASLRTSKLKADFFRWLDRHGCDFADFGPSNWLLSLISEVPGRPTTLQHLLLRAFIGTNGVLVTRANRSAPSSQLIAKGSHNVQ